MPFTNRLDLPLLDAAQAQKHVTHNEALVDLDALLQLSVSARGVTVPAAMPVEGDRVLLGTGATGAFAGHDGAIAAFDNGGWAFFAPRAGWRVFVASENTLLLFDGTVWSDLGLSIHRLENLTALGVGTSSDETNPFAAKLNAGLFTARDAAEGGTGDVRLALNKEAAGNTASYLFQTGYSGRAEAGLTGSDDFAIKVSADGATWRTGLAVQASTGRVSFPSGIAAAGGPGDFCADLPATGLLATWLFDESGGTLCRDRQGSYPIDLAGATNPNGTRTARGLLLRAGLAQTPSLPGAQTVAVLFRVSRGETGGFVMSGGPATNGGLAPEACTPTYAYKIGGGWGLHPLGMRSDGTATPELNRGGWILAFVDFGSGFTGPIGFGGRCGATTARCVEMEIAWAGVWSRALTDADRTAVYTVARRVGAARGIFLHGQDCPTTADIVGLIGDGLADGRSALSGLSAADQALSFAQTWIQPGNAAGTGNWARAKRLELGFNQQATNPATFFGPEFGLAAQHRAAQRTRLRDLYICKLAADGAFLCPSGTSGAVSGSATTVTAANSWNASEPTHGGLYAAFLTMLFDLDQGLRAGGIGPSVVGFALLLGLSDAADTNFTGSAATYQTSLQNLYDRLQADTGLLAPRFVIPRLHSPCAGTNASALAAIRAAQAAFVAANSNALLRNTDSYTLNADGTHFDAAGSKQCGVDLYADLAL